MSKEQTRFVRLSAYSIMRLVIEYKEAELSLKDLLLDVETTWAKCEGVNLNHMKLALMEYMQQYAEQVNIKLPK